MAATHETIADIIAEARDKYTVHECNQCAWDKCCSKGFGSEECGKFRESVFLKLGIEDGYFTQLLDRLEAAYKREVDALNQRCAELDAEVAAKDEVIKRLNDAIAEEQRRKMATTENSSEVGDCAKLREALGNLRAELWNNTVIAGKRKFELYEIADAALAAPATSEKSSVVGDCAKLREALFASRDFICRVLMFLHGMETTFPGEDEITDKIRSALGEAPKMAPDPRSHIFKI